MNPKCSRANSIDKGLQYQNLASHFFFSRLKKYPGNYIATCEEHKIIMFGLNMIELSEITYDEYVVGLIMGS